MQATLDLVAAKALQFIEENIERGHDIDGKPYAYSKKPFYKPFDQRYYNRFGTDGEGKFYNIITGKNGNKGMIILGGYAEYKQQMNPNAANSFLQWTGTMLRNMNIINTRLLSGAETSGAAIGGEVTLGFNDPLEARKAFWLNISGAGRSRKLWKFFGLTTDQQRKLADIAGAPIAQIVEQNLVKSINNNI